MEHALAIPGTTHGPRRATHDEPAPAVHDRSMGDRTTFDVDVAALGELPEAVEHARSICASTDVGRVLDGVGGATGSLSGATGVADLTDALARFVTAGATALQDDADRLRASARSYGDNEQAITSSFAGGSW